MMLDIDTEIINISLESYADDTKLWKTINDIQQATEFQVQLNTIYSWAELNNMSFNDKKFESISFGHTAANQDRRYSTPIYQLYPRQSSRTLEFISTTNLISNSILAKSLPKVTIWQTGFLDLLKLVPLFRCSLCLNLLW